MLVFCDSIKLWTIKIYLFYKHHILGPSVFILGEINAVAVEYKGCTPSCFTSRNSDKTCIKPPLARKRGLITVSSLSGAYSSLQLHIKVPLQSKQKEGQQVFVSSLIHFISLQGLWSPVLLHHRLCWRKKILYSDNRIFK